MPFNTGAKVGFRFQQSSDGIERKAPGSRIVGFLFGVVFALAGGIVLYLVTILPLVEYLKVSGWDEVPCTIETSELKTENDRRGKADHSANIVYRYSYSNTSHTGTRLNIGSFIQDDLDDAQDLLRRYPLGTQSTCHVNPENPRDALLILKLPGLMWYGGLNGLVFLVIGIWFSRRCLYGRRKKSESATPASDQSAPSRWKGDVGGLVGLGLVFLAGVGVIWIVDVIPFVRYLEARDWIATPCNIKSSKVYSNTDSDGVTYGVDIRYSYTFQGKPYTSDTYDLFLSSSDSNYEGKKEIVEYYRPGNVATCYVDPSAPHQAVLNRSLGYTMLWGLLGLAFAAIGAAGIISILRGKKTEKDETKNDGAQTPSATRRPRHIVLERYALGSKMSYRAELILAWVLVVLLAGFIWFFTHGEMEVLFSISLAGLFHLPLFLAAIYFVYRAVRISFAYSNPRIQLTLAPGQDQSPKAKLAWTITEGARAPRSLKLRLVGKHFHHVDGTTRQKKFFEKEVANVSDRTIKSGEVEFDVPQDVLLQSFDGEDKVGWFVVAELKFVNWPGSKVEFRIVTKESTEMLHSPPPTQI
ncbi:MAG: DUF3592 domain-containing protein [Planctomycetaceae bacterium]|nr:DUF3592 domain-containing protein [Planctomycetaceae bacterium]